MCSTRLYFTTYSASAAAADVLYAIVMKTAVNKIVFTVCNVDSRESISPTRFFLVLPTVILWKKSVQSCVCQILIGTFK